MGRYFMHKDFDRVYVLSKHNVLYYAFPAWDSKLEISHYRYHEHHHLIKIKNPAVIFKIIVLIGVVK